MIDLSDDNKTIREILWTICAQQAGLWVYLCLNFKNTFSIFGSFSYFSCPFGEAFNRQTILAILVILYLIIFFSKTRELASLAVVLELGLHLLDSANKRKHSGILYDVPWFKKKIFNPLFNWKIALWKSPSSISSINSTF